MHNFLNKILLMVKTLTQDENVLREREKGREIKTTNLGRQTLQFVSLFHLPNKDTLNFSKRKQSSPE